MRDRNLYKEEMQEIMKAFKLLFVLLLIGITMCVDPVFAEDKVEKEAIGEKKAYSNATKTFTLNDCIEHALMNNPDIAIENSNIAAATARLNQAKAGLLPFIGIEGGYQLFLDDQRLIQARFNGEPGYFDDNLFRADMVIRVPIYTFGRITEGIESAEFLKRASHYKSIRTKDELIYNISNVFYSIIGQRHIIDSLEFSKKALSEQHKTINQMMEVKKAAKIDILRVEVRLASIEQSIVRERNTLSILKHTLADLMGLDQRQEIDINGDLSFDYRSYDLKELVDSALAVRPDYLSLKSEFDAQSKRVEMAKGEYLPSVYGIGSYGYRANSRGNSGDLGFIGLSISAPLYDPRISPKISEERSKLMALQERLRKMVLQIKLDVESAILYVQSSAERVRASEKAIEQAREGLRIEQQKYELGKGSITDILDAQAALLLSETNYYKALADFQISKTRLNLSIGGSL